MLIHIIQHVPFEKPGLIIEWIKDNNHSAEIVEIFNGNTLPKAEDVSFLIVLGGPMSANYSEEWIKEGRLLIKEVVDNGKAMLGICLGAQQLAKAYGSEILVSPKEVGWSSVSSITQAFHPSGDYTVLHWHGEGYTLPEGATLLYSTKDWKNQGFRI